MKLLKVFVTFAILSIGISSCLVTQTDAIPNSMSTAAGRIDSAMTYNPAASGKFPLKLFVPLYVDPNTDWDRIAEAASRVPITVIINPNDGPGGSPTVEYLAGIKKLHNAGVTVLGYVYTNYGARNLKDVETDVDLYKQFGIDGIFIDNAAQDLNTLEYYKLLSDYVRSDNFGAVWLNPGYYPDEAYIKNSIGDTTNIFEADPTDPSAWSKWLSYQPPKYISYYDPDRFASLVFGTPSASAMRSGIDLAVSRGIGNVFFTDQSEGLPSFWDAEVDYVAAGVFNWWSAFPGATASTPAIASYNGEFYMVVRGTDNGIYYQKTTGGVWPSTWQLIPGASNDAPALAVLDNNLHLVVRGTDNGIYHNKMDLTTGTWSGFAKIPGATSSQPSLSTSTGTLHLTIRGTDNGIYYNSWSQSAGWTGFRNIPGATSDAPAVMSQDGTDLHLAVRGTNNGIYWDKKALSSSTWPAWTAIPGATASSPTFTWIPDTGNGVIQLVVRGTNNGMYYNSYKTGWGNWQYIPGATTIDKPALAHFESGTNNYVFLVVRGTDNGIYYNRNTNGLWSGFTQIPGSTASYPAIAVASNGQVAIAIRGTDNGIYIAYVG